MAGRLAPRAAIELSLPLVDALEDALLDLVAVRQGPQAPANLGAITKAADAALIAARTAAANLQTAYALSGGPRASGAPLYTCF